ncbi:hypothetical protein DFP72DRAFT_1073001 [Ephemerocybe angulata]|uniref:Uncharacterized protein n=1 Tax=Ephemerocybe angulata TaxID=980116 RepID=A0A8H6M0G3_9AGAR|nr:hypothetical protein DFP72DRAFT_1073001 [Tulosesus angulatus]
MPDSLTITASPTTSTHSVHFHPSLALCDNKPEEMSRMASLDLLNLKARLASRRRDGSRPSNATSATEAGSEDHGLSDSDLRHVHSAATSATHVDASSVLNSSKTSKSGASDSVSQKKQDKEKKGETSVDDGKTAHQIELEQHAAINPAPFAFKP